MHFPTAPPEGVLAATEKKEKKISMAIENVHQGYARRNQTRRHQLLPLFIALVLALTIGASKAKAQITDDLEVNIPFQFHAGDTKLPAGEYRIHVLEDSDLRLMEISSANGSVSALFQVQDRGLNSTPANSELIFNKYGDRYFLTELFEEGSASGSQVVKSRYEKAVSQQAAEAQEHVTAHRRTQQGK
jgi:hypothetical protein